MMKLYYSPTSPFARKVRVALIEKTLTDTVEMISVSPQENPADLLKANPLGKIPTLVLEDGQAIYDSAVITGYLETLSGRTLMPEKPDDRTDVLIREALADGMMEAAFNIAMETRRPDAEQSVFWIERWENAVMRALKTLSCPSHTDTPDIGDLALACALGYLDFRHAARFNWRSVNPALADWYQAISQRKSLRETMPPEG